jgi:hypothetical protein
LFINMIVKYCNLKCTLIIFLLIGQTIHWLVYYPLCYRIVSIQEHMSINGTIVTTSILTSYIMQFHELCNEVGLLPLLLCHCLTSTYPL